MLVVTRMAEEGQPATTARGGLPEEDCGPEGMKWSSIEENLVRVSITAASGPGPPRICLAPVGPLAGAGEE